MNLTFSFPYVVEGQDFTVTSSTTVIFDSGATSNADMECVQILIEDDDAYEENEVFLFSILSVAPTSAVSIGTQQATKTIQDNFGKN